MAVQRISQKEFQNRRRDRRMVWVDALAFLLGLMIVTASVGGVIFYEAEVEPIEWTPVFFEQNVNETRTCYGFAGGIGDGCQRPISSNPQREGPDNAVEWAFPPVTAANVTEVSFRLSWLVDVPETGSPGCDDSGYCNRQFEYDANATAIMNLTVIAPWGEEFHGEGMNNWENVIGGSGVAAGAFRVTVPVLQMPDGEEAPTVKSFSQAEAEAVFNESYRVEEHDGLGTWRAIVTVVRESAMNGTVPRDMCAAVTGQDGVPLDEDDVPLNDDQCDTYEVYELITGEGQGASQGGLPSDYPGLYGDELWGVAGDLNNQSPVPYRSSWQSEGQSWVLSMSVRAYEAMAGV